ncbi:selenocysteine-specific translation elongation factor [Desulfurobacterium atlanticum]|uniref:Selenocysteine-specific elongation factor n=1 Tax=Desulfurobacterium atlanticum TaxID=240169 RepID=A0A238XMJ8_9BACT|nr:selenocysteine-specific translation elongation factor [Desulfurobacterium atlanticum]SNR60195.1 selenocysteine-specific translation elongation factor SelB [Desulfurobacterium atlanticum]
MKKSVTIGTAGHIDHGKTSLVKRLTGVDTDRLKEEKERGMTIELGFAHMKLGDYLISIVDVPGHEKFIKNMVAGAQGIDGVLFVIAADEGVMPQTKEHLTVCEMLGIKKGIVVLTKVDMVDDEWLELVEEDVRDYLKGSFLENAPFVRVSSKTGEGFDILKEEILKLVKNIPENKEYSFPRLPVDRVFSVKGFGTVVTGTLSGGLIEEGEELSVYPSLKSLKVKGIQVAGEKVSKAYPGQRVALNVSLSLNEIERGDILAPAGILDGSNLIDAVITFSKNMEPFEKRKRIHFHYLTQMVEGEIVLIDKDVAEPASSSRVQIILDREIFPVYGDRFILRSITPSEVIGGGMILHPLERKRYRKKFKQEFVEKIKQLEEGRKKALKVFVSQFEPLEVSKLPQFLNLYGENLNLFLKEVEEMGDIVRVGDFLYRRDSVDKVFRKALEFVSDFHKKYPVLEGINRETLKSFLNVDSALFEKVISESAELLSVSKYVKLKDFNPYLDETFKKIKEKVDTVLLREKFSPPSVEKLREEIGEPKDKFYALLEFLQKNGYKMAGEFLIHPEIFDEIVEKLKSFKATGSFKVAEFKDLLSISRKHAIPLLELLDREGITEREADGTRKLKV